LYFYDFDLDDWHIILASGDEENFELIYSSHEGIGQAGRAILEHTSATVQSVGVYVDDMQYRIEDLRHISDIEAFIAEFGA
jgi:hypothetical protein